MLTFFPFVDFIKIEHFSFLTLTILHIILFFYFLFFNIFWFWFYIPYTPSSFSLRQIPPRWGGILYTLYPFSLRRIPYGSITFATTWTWSSVPRHHHRHLHGLQPHRRRPCPRYFLIFFLLLTHTFSLFLSLNLTLILA